MEEPGLSLLSPQQSAAQGWNQRSDVQAVLGPAVVLTHHVSGQCLLRPLERFHVVDDERLQGEGFHSLRIQCKSRNVNVDPLLPACWSFR